jgi:hypothetical protein
MRVGRFFLIPCDRSRLSPIFGRRLALAGA